MIYLQTGRKHIREHPFRTLTTALVILIVMQVMMSETVYHRFSLSMIAFVFAFKSWVNLVFSVTTHKQRGETDLSVSIERYFWALLGQSIAFTILFTVSAFTSAVPNPSQAGDWFGINLVVIRNAILTVAIVSVISVIVYGDQTLESLKAYIEREKEKTDDHVRQT